MARRSYENSLPDTAHPPRRVVIERVQPEIDGGRFAVKRVSGEPVVVDARIFADGHEVLSCVLRHREESEDAWTPVPFTFLGNDQWRATFVPMAIGRHRYTIDAWVDPVRTWQRDLAARRAVGEDLRMPLLVGAALLDDAAARAPDPDAERLRTWSARLREGAASGGPEPTMIDDMVALAAAYPDPAHVSRYARELPLVVDRERARFSTWYEVFPRSCAAAPGRHGTFQDCAAWLPDIAAMGFDVVYLPPIHPIGSTFRKGRNNTPAADPGDVGSPWAIGAREGGHMAVHPRLGTIEDFRAFVGRAHELGLEVALDIAFQCSPDHPYVTGHPEWFRHRPDGTIQYAENPPKKYQDIYPFDFDTADWRSLWQELARVFRFWIEQGVRIFRVDNPHTKPLPFWEWVIGDIKAEYPDVLFLAEAFTRPGPMYYLAKLGFTQSYTYFTWRNTKAELTEYFTELVQTDVREYFRPNLWPNTPDILHAFLQTGGPPAFRIRAVLAATLGASYGIYGPAFELCEREPREPGSEEYRHSEKYEIRQRALDAGPNLRPLITRLNQIRREHAALQSDRSLAFHATDNPLLLCYSKHAAGGRDPIVTVCSLDPFNPQSGWVTLDLARLGITDAPYAVQDLLTGSRYVWRGPRNYVALTPDAPAHVLRVEPV